MLEFIKRRLLARRGVLVGDRFHIGFGTSISAPNRLRIGSDVSIGRHCRIFGDGQIGSRVLIGDQVGIFQPGDVYRDSAGYVVERSSQDNVALTHFTGAGSIAIEDDVRLGFGAIVMGGVTVGRGAIVMPGAVVTSYVAPYSVMLGNPATAVRQLECRHDGAAGDGFIDAPALGSHREVAQ